MTDTSFALPAAKRARYALALAKDPLTGSANPAIHHGTDKTQKWESGGGGAVSTATDYLRFAEMLRRGGELGTAEVLGRGTVALMTADHLPASFNNMIADKMDPAATGYGFGLGFAVRRQDGIAAMAGSAGDYYWSGVYGTYFWVDPKEELTVVFMAAAPGLDPPALPPDDAQPRVPGADRGLISHFSQKEAEENAMITKFDSLFAGHTDLDNFGYDGTPINERRYDNEHLATSLVQGRGHGPDDGPQRLRHASGWPSITSSARARSAFRTC